MAVWEYRVITSGRGGFATPALLETFLNQLGKDDWEIISFHQQPDNPLAFTGLARRTLQREWTLESAHAAQAAKEAREKRLAEQAAAEAAIRESQGGHAPSADPTVPPGAQDQMHRDEGFRRLRETEYDQDPEALHDDEEDFEDLNFEEEVLPTFFEAIRPHMRRNQRGPGYSVSVDYLLKKFDMLDGDLTGALEDCGFVIPDDEDDDPVYLEYDGDLYWVNTNKHGQLFINTREKPRPIFRTVKGTSYAPPEGAVDPSDTEKPTRGEKGKDRDRNRRQKGEQKAAQAEAPDAAADAESAESHGSDEPESAEPAAPAEPPPPLPTEAVELLDLLRPHMRRNRRSPGISGSISYLARALRYPEAELTAALAAVGVTAPAEGEERSPAVEIGTLSFYTNKDNRGSIWINGRERPVFKPGAPAPEGASEGGSPESGDTSTASAPSDADATAPAGDASQSAAEVSEGSPASTETGTSTSTEPAPAAGTTDAAPEGTVPTPSEGASPAAESTDDSDAPSDEEGDDESEDGDDEDDDAEGDDSDDDDGEPEADAPEGAPSSPVLAAVRLLLKPNRRGSGVSGEVGYLARQVEKSDEDFVASLTAAGLEVPETPDDKPTFVVHGPEIFWLNRSSSDGALWLNAKKRIPRRRGGRGGRGRGPRRGPRRD